MYVITGATGNTGRVATKRLLSRGQKVRAIARTIERLKPLADAGAEPFPADLNDAGALTKAFAGAQAVYVLLPPDLSSQDPLGDRKRTINSIASALENAKVRHVVSLSSVGAEKTEKTGPVLALHWLEEKLNAIPGLNTLYLRAGYFMENTLGQAEVIRALGKMAGPLRGDLKLALIATQDIGEAVAAALQKLDFKGHQTRELQGQRDLSMTEATAIVGKAVAMPDLQYVQLSDEQLRPAFAQMRMSVKGVELLLEMAAALNSGHMRPLEKRSAQNTTPTSYEDFVAKVFVPAYKARGKAA